MTQRNSFYLLWKHEMGALMQFHVRSRASSTELLTDGKLPNWDGQLFKGAVCIRKSRSSILDRKQNSYFIFAVCLSTRFALGHFCAHFYVFGSQQRTFAQSLYLRGCQRVIYESCGTPNGLRNTKNQVYTARCCWLWVCILLPTTFCNDWNRSTVFEIQPITWNLQEYMW